MWGQPNSLILDGQRLHRREALADRLWPTATSESAAKSFRTALWRLRSALEPEGTPSGAYIITSPNSEIGFNWDSDFTADVLEFESGIKAFADPSSDLPPEQRIHELKVALDLYSGELLDGSVDEWLIYERERLRRLYLRGLKAMLRTMFEMGRYNTAIRYGRKILALDPLQESTHRDMLRLYAKNGEL